MIEAVKAKPVLKLKGLRPGYLTAPLAKVCAELPCASVYLSQPDGHAYLLTEVSITGKMAAVCFRQDGQTRKLLVSSLTSVIAYF